MTVQCVPGCQYVRHCHLAGHHKTRDFIWHHIFHKNTPNISYLLKLVIWTFHQFSAQCVRAGAGAGAGAGATVGRLEQLIKILS